MPPLKGDTEGAWGPQPQVYQERVESRQARHYPYSTVQYSTVQYSTVQFSAVQYSAVQYSTVQYSTVPYRTVPYSIVQYNTVHYSTVQYSTVHYSTVQYWWRPHQLRVTVRLAEDPATAGAPGFTQSPLQRRHGQHFAPAAAVHLIGRTRGVGCRLPEVRPKESGPKAMEGVAQGVGGGEGGVEGTEGALQAAGQEPAHGCRLVRLDVPNLKPQTDARAGGAGQRDAINVGSPRSTMRPAILRV